MTENANDLMREFMLGNMTRRELLASAGAAGIGVSALATAVSTPWLSTGASAQASGDLVVAIAQDIDTLDPHISQLLMFGDTLRRTVRAEARNGVAVLVIEHNMDFVMGVADVITVLDQGQRICEGTPAVVRGDARVIEAYLGSAAGQGDARGQ